MISISIGFLRPFFRKLNIQLNENNLKLLITYLRSFIADTLFKSLGLNLYSGKTRLFDFAKDNYDSALVYPSKEGAKNQEYDYQRKDYVIISKIKNGILTTKNSIPYVNEKFEDFQSEVTFNDWVKKFNKDFVEKTKVRQCEYYSPKQKHNFEQLFAPLYLVYLLFYPS